MDIIVFHRRLVMPSPTDAFIFTTARLHYRFASVAADSCSLHYGNATLSSWWSDFIFIIFGTGKLYCCYFASFATSPTTTSL
uniref:HGWP repeat containing protein-like n=1 Tax=Oryza sativa subsp. japonica TaxID=39947 RepID=Q5Z5U7_ORYSJ|nr:HGWP repeat containing protein-like [Oryza sativa Japonica Group]